MITTYKILPASIFTIFLLYQSAFAWDTDFRELVKTADYATIKQAIKNGADVNFQPGWEAFNVATITPIISAICANRIDSLELLLKYGANPNLPYNKGISPLMEAAERGSLEAVKILLEHKVDIHQVDGFDKDALFYAVIGKHADVVEFLLKNGANPNHQDDLGSTALHKVYGNQELADILIKYGADKRIKDRDGIPAEVFMKQQ